MNWLGGQLKLEPETIQSFLLSYEDILNQVLTAVRELLPDILNLSVRIGSGLVNFLVSGMVSVIVSIYILTDKEKLFEQCRNLLYAVASRTAAGTTLRVCRLANGVFSSFISGKLLDSAIIGVICFVGMSLIDATVMAMPFALLISVIVGVTNIIPFFGPFIGAVPSAMILLMINPPSAFWFTVFIVILQQFDGNILGPKILGGLIGLPPLWVLAAIILGGGFFGFLGMVAGVPVTAVLYTLFREWLAARLQTRARRE
jgi:predicted PurR-regulated permease PerM